MKKHYLLFCLILAASQLSYSQFVYNSSSGNDKTISKKAISNALEFDGTDDFVGISNGTALFANLTEFSMCGWVYAQNPNTAWPDLDGFFGIKDENVCDFYIAQINGIGVEARITTDGGTFTIDPPLLSSVVVDEWHHYALVYTGSELQLYLDGTLDGSVAATGEILYNNLELTLGKLVFGTNDFYLDGKLDEITMWDKALTDIEIQENMCITGDPLAVDNLTAYFNFNEEDGLVLPDYFDNYNGALTNMSGDEWMSSEVCESGFTITFEITDEVSGDPVENADVSLDGLIKTTDASGIAEFTNYDPGTYNYEVSHNDYYDATGSVEVIDEDILEEVSLAPILYYSITFIVTQDPGSDPIDSAIVNLDGALKYTDETGMAIFDGYLPGNYTYNVSKEGYSLVPGSVDIIDENITVEVSLISNLTYYSITFMVVEDPGSNPIDGAEVDLEGTIKYTDETGIAVFEDYLPGSYNYTVSKEGFFSIPGTVVLIDEDITEEISLLIDKIEETQMDLFKVYPNPVQHILYIDVSAEKGNNMKANLLDLSGKKISTMILNHGKNELNTNNIQKGMYLLEVELSSSKSTQLIIIQ